MTQCCIDRVLSYCLPVWRCRRCARAVRGDRRRLAIAQLIPQVQTLQQQLATARSAACSQAQAELPVDDRQSRACSSCLPARSATTCRPAGRSCRPCWQAAAATALAHGSCRAQSARNAVLTPQQLATLSPADQHADCRPRGNQSRCCKALSHEALANSSARFASIQQLIDAISPRRRSERHSGAAGTHRRRAGDAAERADQAAGALSERAGQQWADAQRARELVDRRPRAVRHPLPADTLSRERPHGLLRDILDLAQWAARRATSATTRRA